MLVAALVVMLSFICEMFGLLSLYVESMMNKVNHILFYTYCFFFHSINVCMCVAVYSIDTFFVCLISCVYKESRSMATQR